ncbi:MAG: dCMP deaminase family protein [bacterium]|nr:dCMP deaminase family protein [bacterium]
MEKRISKEGYYLGLAQGAAKRAVCFRRFSGAVIVKEDQIVSTGYTGSPRKTLDCFEREFCLRDKLEIPSGQRYELCASVHAEQNALINAGRAGVSFLGGDIYIFGQTRDGKPIDAFPCFICKKMIINAGLKRVICSTKEGGMRVFIVETWIEEWKDRRRNITDDDVQYGKGLKINK